MGRLAPWHRWESATVERTFTVESRQKSKALFLQTHLPMDRILVDACREGGAPVGGFIDEAGLLTLLRRAEATADNRIFFVVGETGCGKSELCQWLEYSLQGSRQVPIHLSRRTTHTSEIARVLAQHLPEGAAAFAGGAFDLERVPAEDLAMRLASGALVRALAQRNIPEPERAAWGTLLRDRGFFDLVTGEVLTYYQRLHDPEADRSFLDFWPADTHAAYLAGRAGAWQADLPQNHHRKLREWLLAEIRSLLQIENLNVVLEQVSRHYASLGKRPVLILEDITTFGFLRDDLFDYLFDLTSGHFDAVIGLTSGFERTQLNAILSEDDMTYLQERIAGRFVLTGDEGTTFFLEADRPVDLVRRYLEAVAPAKPMPEDPFDGLYPFNREAILRLFASLAEEGQPKQTPRLLLNHLVRQILLSEDLPHVFLAKENAHLLPPLTEFRMEEAEGAGLGHLLRWFGTHDDEAVTLDRRIADTWKVPYPEALVQDGRLVLPRLRIQTTAPAAIFKRPEPAIEDWQLALRELQSWLEWGETFPSREFLKRGTERFLMQLGNPRTLSRPGAIAASADMLAYTRGEDRIPHVLAPNSGDPDITDGLPRLLVHRDEASRAILEELLLYQWSDRADMSLFAKPAKTLAWVQDRHDRFSSDVRLYLRDKLNGVDWDIFVLFAWSVVRNLAIGTPVQKSADLVGRLPADWAFDEGGIPWRAPAQQSPYHSVVKWTRQLLGEWTAYQGLMTGVYYLRENFIDRDYLETQLEDFQPAKLMSQIAGIDLSALRTVPYRTARGRHPVFAFVEPLVRYLQALEKLDMADSVATMKVELRDLAETLDAQTGLTREELYSQLQVLRGRYGMLGMSWSQSLEHTQELIRHPEFENLSPLQAEVADIRRLFKARRLSDPFVYVSLHHRYRNVLNHPFVQVHQAIEVALRAMQDGAKKRYGTNPRARVVHNTAAYKQLNDALLDLKGTLI
jgi:hypothetical protein